MHGTISGERNLENYTHRAIERSDRQAGRQQRRPAQALRTHRRHGGHNACAAGARHNRLLRPHIAGMMVGRLQRRTGHRAGHDLLLLLLANRRRFAVMGGGQWQRLLLLLRMVMRRQLLLLLWLHELLGMLVEQLLGLLLHVLLVHHRRQLLVRLLLLELVCHQLRLNDKRLGGLLLLLLLLLRTGQLCGRYQCGRCGRLRRRRLLRRQCGAIVEWLLQMDGRRWMMLLHWRCRCERQRLRRRCHLDDVLLLMLLLQLWRWQLLLRFRQAGCCWRLLAAGQLNVMRHQVRRNAGRMQLRLDLWDLQDLGGGRVLRLLQRLLLLMQRQLQRRMRLGRLLFRLVLLLLVNGGHIGFRNDDRRLADNDMMLLLDHRFRGSV